MACDVVGIVGQLCPKLGFGFRVDLLRPQQVSQAEVHVGLFRIGFDGRPEHLGRAFVVLHLVEGFARDHVGFGRFGIEGEDLVVDVHDARVLLRP